MLLLSSKSREQKKLVPSLPSAKVISANVCVMVDFLVPARPLSQKTCWPSSFSCQSSSCCRTSPLVPLRHPRLFPERWPARRNDTCHLEESVLRLPIHHDIRMRINWVVWSKTFAEIIEKSLSLPLFCQWLDFSENFPTIPACQARTSTLESLGSLFQRLPPFSFLEITLGNR